MTWPLTACILQLRVDTLQGFTKISNLVKTVSGRIALIGLRFVIWEEISQTYIGNWMGLQLCRRNAFELYQREIGAREPFAIGCGHIDSIKPQDIVKGRL